MKPNWPDLYERAAMQRGLLTRADLDDLGVTRSVRQRLLRAGTLAPIGIRTFALGGRVLDARDRTLAACLEHRAVAAPLTASWLHGIPSFGPPEPPQVLRRGRKGSYRSAIADVHTTTNLGADDLVVVDGIPCTSVARTLFGLAASVPTLPLDRVRGAVDDAIRLGLASDAWLWWRLEQLRCRGRGGVSVLEAILVDRAGSGPTESWLERAFIRLCREAGLPIPICQARIEARGAFVARVDFLDADLRLVIEVTGAVAHSTPAQRAADARRRNALVTAGYLVLEFTDEQIVREPADVIDQVRRARSSRLAA